METLLSVESPEELRRELAAFNTEVSPRAFGRTTKQTELYAIAHLLASLPPGRLGYPLSVDHGDRPDFVLRQSGQSTGIEHTEAVAENLARASVLRTKRAGPPVHFMQRASPGEPRKSSTQLLQEIQADQPGPPWEGDAPEREWAEAMLHFAGVKTEKAQRQGFARHRENWLLVYDNWSVPAVSYSEAGSLLQEKCIEASIFTTFDRVYVLGSRLLCEVGKNLHETHAVASPRVGS